MTTLAILTIMFIIALFRSNNNMGLDGVSAVNVYFGIKLALSLAGALVLIGTALFFMAVLFP